MLFQFCYLRRDERVAPELLESLLVFVLLSRVAAFRRGDVPEVGVVVVCVFDWLTVFCVLAGAGAGVGAGAGAGAAVSALR